MLATLTYDSHCISDEAANHYF